MVCYKAGKERGAWFELKAIRDVITGKESRGESATFERGLYEAWIKYQEYKKADKENRSRGLYGTLSPLADKRDFVSKTVDIVNTVPLNNETKKQGNLKAEDTIVTPPKKGRRGRPRKIGSISRATAWRRKKELQGALL